MAGYVGKKSPWLTRGTHRNEPIRRQRRTDTCSYPRHSHAALVRLDDFLLALGRQRYVRRLRSVLEVCHASWFEPTVIDRLRDANVALCFHDWRAQPVTAPVTADFVYVRRHGTSPRKYHGA